MNRLINLDQVVHLFQEELQESLTGMYLHGSMAMGCFHPEHSDIDILVVVKSKQPRDTYKRIASGLIRFEEELHLTKGIELSVVLKKYTNEFVYPTPFEFHYSLAHKEKYKADPDYLCGGYEDTDLAAHFVVIYHRGIVLYGKSIRDVFTAIDKSYFIASIQSDVKEATEGIIENPVYYVLNLCRVLFFFKEEVISSKREGGEWATKVVPKKYVVVIDNCLAAIKVKLM
ncbi:nucleotidyltransferase domain-containing protein [Paenibacillus gallinarum]|uniref:nucleotidyltransferase domain-containing protein n=1 Tax=Paenibacillus gallinarum TaxID=2762232 RepID=UPI001CD867EC|nr:nucleotidyltransferase domain-containing protein [Paenibacillus gallinarum]